MRAGEKQAIEQASRLDARSGDPSRHGAPFPIEAPLPVELLRRPAAVLAVEIVARSAADEDAARARAHVVEPIIAAHRGRARERMHDGGVAIFPSAQDAVASAVAMRAQLKDADADAHPSIAARIGLHAAEHDDIDAGAAIAAQIAALAGPGEIHLSGPLRSLLDDDAAPACLDLGERDLPGAPAPLRIFQIAGDHAPREEAMELPDKPSIAVLPFINRGGDAADEPFCDGLTDDVIAELSRFSGFLVIQRASSFTYKGRAVDVAQVSRELGVRYVLQGGVRRSGDRVRVDAELIDAPGGRHVWSEQYDRRFADLFRMQEDITQAVVATAESQIVLAEGRRLAERPRPTMEVAELIRFGWGKCYDLKYDSYQIGKETARKIIRLDPSNSRGFQILSAAIVHEHYLGLMRHSPAELSQAAAWALHATQLDEHCEYSRWTLGACYMFDNEHERGIAALRHAIEINPNFSIAYATLGTVLGWAGKFEAAIVAHDMSLRMNPRDPARFFRHFGKALASHLLDRHEEAIRYAETCVQLRPDWHLGWAMLAVASLRAGRRRSAANYAERCRQLLGSPRLEDSHLPFADARYRDVIRRELKEAMEAV